MPKFARQEDLAASLSKIKTELDGKAPKGDVPLCSTAANDAVKTVSITNFKLEPGAMVTVKFRYANTASDPALKVGSAEAKPIYFDGRQMPAKYIKPDDLWIFEYDGSYYHGVRVGAQPLSAANPVEVTNEEFDYCVDEGYYRITDWTNPDVNPDNIETDWIVNARVIQGRNNYDEFYVAQIIYTYDNQYYRCEYDTLEYVRTYGIDASWTQQFLRTSDAGCTATRVVGTTKSGHTLAQCDYLCSGTNDQGKIQSAINSLPSTGGKIVLLEGTYNLSGAINVNMPNATIEGMGMGATVLNKTAGNNSYNTVTHSNCIFRNMSFTREEGSNDLALYVNGTNAVGFKCIDVELSNFSIGINVNAARALIRDVYFHDFINSVERALILNTNSVGSVVEGCYFKDNAGINIAVDGSYNKIHDNYIIRGTGKTSDYTSSQHTIQVKGTYNDVSDNYILGKNYTNSGGTTNTFENNRYE